MLGKLLTYTYLYIKIYVTIMYTYIYIYPKILKASYITDINTLKALICYCSRYLIIKSEDLYKIPTFKLTLDNCVNQAVKSVLVNCNRRKVTIFRSV